MTDDSIVRFINEAREESERARDTRMKRNRANREAYLGHQDWSAKIKGQSREFLPKTSSALEQLAAFIKRSMVSLGDWFSAEAPKDAPLDSWDIQRLLKDYVDNLPNGSGQYQSLATRLGDGVKSGALESLIILKCTGRFHPTRRVEADENGRPRVVENTPGVWRPNIELVRSEDYYPDPSGNNLYEIHRVERDLHDVIAMSEGDNPIYDPEAVQQLVGTYQERPEDEERREVERGQDETHQPAFRKKVVIDEFWGTILNEDGTVKHRNVVAAIANDSIEIRPPEDNPWWHGESPFVVSPLHRVPHSVWHKALYDDAVGLNFAINELFNLMLDGGIASVWGIRQVRAHYLENPEQISEGIPQGQTLVLREDAPEGAKAVENVENPGQVPQDAMVMLQTLDREFNVSALTNEIKLGNLPQKEVRATEVVESIQGQSSVMDSVTGDLENDVIEPTLRKTWLNMVQHFDALDAGAVMGQIDQKKAVAMFRMADAERFALFFQGSQFKVTGLSETMRRSRDFQKMMAVFQAAGSNPLMMRSFMRAGFSGQKMLQTIFRALNFDPEHFRDTEGQEGTPEEQQRDIASIQQVLGSGGGREALNSEAIGEGGLASDIRQNADPSMAGEAGNQ